LQALRAHTWPGNVRELEHWVESAIVLSPDGEIAEELFPGSQRLPSSPSADAEQVALPLGLPLQEVQRRYVVATMQACDGNKTEAARRLQVGRNTVARALKPG
jgi:Nif-specific regulatory protein